MRSDRLKREEAATKSALYLIALLVNPARCAESSQRLVIFFHQTHFFRLMNPSNS
jgi:hypothetical protein